MENWNSSLPEGPMWATQRLVDESLIEYICPIGVVGTCGDDPDFEVAVTQQDEYDLVAVPPNLSRHEMEIRLSGVCMSSTQARELADVLSRGADLVESVSRT